MFQKFIGSLTRPRKIHAKSSRLFVRPVVSGLERGAELFGGAPLGAPRMFGGEVGFQSKLAYTGHIPRSHHMIRSCDHRSGDRFEATRSGFGLGLSLVRVRTWLQLDTLFPVKRLVHPPPLLYGLCARSRSISNTRSLLSMRSTARPSLAARIESAFALPCLPARRRRCLCPSGFLVSRCSFLYQVSRANQSQDGIGPSQSWSQIHRPIPTSEWNHE